MAVGCNSTMFFLSVLEEGYVSKIDGVQSGSGDCGERVEGTQGKEREREGKVR